MSKKFLLHLSPLTTTLRRDAIFRRVPTYADRFSGCKDEAYREPEP
jgi:hypothetical protein